jgi:hypothetical protein
MIYDANDGEHYTRLFDISGHNEAVFAMFTDANAPYADAKYYYATWQDGNTLVNNFICNAGCSIIASGETDVAYFAGAFLGEKKGEVDITREESGEYFLEKYTTTNDGADWTVDLLLHYDDRKIFRPVVPVDTVKNVPVLFCEGWEEDPNGGYGFYSKGKYYSFIDIITKQPGVYSAWDLNCDNRVDFFDFTILAAHWLEETEQ